MGKRSVIRRKTKSGRILTRATGLKRRYVNNSISAENALQEMFNIIGLRGSICYCMGHEWVFSGDKELCSNCNKVMIDWSEDD